MKTFLVTVTYTGECVIAVEAKNAKQAEKLVYDVFETPDDTETRSVMSETIDKITNIRKE